MTAAICVPPGMIDDVWPHVRAMLSKGLDVAGADRVETARNLLSGAQLLWIIADDLPRRIRAVWLTELAELDGARRVVVSALAGENPPEWANTLETRMAEYAAEERAASVRFCGRPAWGRLLPKCKAIGTIAPGVNIYERAAA